MTAMSSEFSAVRVRRGPHRCHTAASATALDVVARRRRTRLRRSGTFKAAARPGLHGLQLHGLRQRAPGGARWTRPGRVVNDPLGRASPPPCAAPYHVRRRVVGRWPGIPRQAPALEPRPAALSVHMVVRCGRPVDVEEGARCSSGPQSCRLRLCLDRRRWNRARGGCCYGRHSRTLIRPTTYHAQDIPQNNAGAACVRFNLSTARNRRDVLPRN